MSYAEMAAVIKGLLQALARQEETSPKQEKESRHHGTALPPRTCGKVQW